DWSADPEPVPYANFTNPQTLNLYAIVADNPATDADSDGHVVELAPGNEAFEYQELCDLVGAACKLMHPPQAAKDGPAYITASGSLEDWMVLGGQRAAEVYLMITSPQVFVCGGFRAGFVTGAVWNEQHQVCDDPCQEMRKANRLKLGADIVMLLSLIPESKELRAEGMQLEEEAEMLRAEADAEAEAAAESKAGGGPGAAKDRSLQGRQDQLEGLEKHQDQVTKKGGYRISKGKSKLDFKHGLNQIKTSKDVEDQ